MRIAHIALPAALLLAATPAVAKDIYKLGSFAPGLAPYTVNTAWAAAVNKHVPDVEIQVIATGPATKHQLDTLQGRMDFFMSGPIGMKLMRDKIGPFKDLKEGPELVKDMCSIMTYQLGPYHIVTYADDNIRQIEDLKGKRVFIGPPGGAATRGVQLMLEQHSGLKADQDYETLKADWGPAQQAFQDRKIDAMVVPSNVPGAGIQQVALTSDIYLLSFDPEKMKTMPVAKELGRSFNVIPKDAYGPRQKNTADIHTFGTVVNLSTRCSLDEEVVYKMTKAFFENIKEAHGMAAWMPSTVNLKAATTDLVDPVHKGALRYYEEAGVKVVPYVVP